MPEVLANNRVKRTRAKGSVVEQKIATDSPTVGNAQNNYSKRFINFNLVNAPNHFL